MAIDGAPRISSSEETKGVDMADRAALATASLVEVFGPTFDQDAVTESAERDFRRLAEIIGGRSVETYLHVPLGAVEGSNRYVTVESMLTSADSIERPDGSAYPRAYPLDAGKDDLSRRIWLPPDATKEGLSNAAINRLSLPGEPENPKSGTIHARVALADGPNPDEPLLHLLGKPFDAMHAGPDEETQLDGIRRLRAEFAVQTNDQAELALLTFCGTTMLAVQRRLEGRKLKRPVRMPMEWGFARVVSDRATVDGDSFVGSANSNGDQLKLDRSYGGAYPIEGVGLSAGLQEKA